MALDRALDGRGAPPDEWLLSRLCEELGVPLVAGGALDQPLALALDVLELRAYARAKAALEAAEKPEDVPRTPAVGWVGEVQAALWQERQARRGAEADVGER
jgi:hypothetical protein